MAKSLPNTQLTESKMQSNGYDDPRLELLSRTFIKRVGDSEETFTVVLAPGASERAIDFARRSGYVPSEGKRERMEGANTLLDLAIRRLVVDKGVSEGVIPADEDDWMTEDRKAIAEGVKLYTDNIASLTDRIAAKADELTASYVPPMREVTRTKTKLAVAAKAISI